MSLSLESFDLDDDEAVVTASIATNGVTTGSVCVVLCTYEELDGGTQKQRVELMRRWFDVDLEAPSEVRFDLSALDRDIDGVADLQLLWIGDKAPRGDMVLNWEEA